jgi:hypothetical protein
VPTYVNKNMNLNTDTDMESVNASMSMSVSLSMSTFVSYPCPCSCVSFAMVISTVTNNISTLIYCEKINRSLLKFILLLMDNFQRLKPQGWSQWITSALLLTHSTDQINGSHYSLTRAHSVPIQLRLVLDGRPIASPVLWWHCPFNYSPCKVLVHPTLLKTFCNQGL